MESGAINPADYDQRGFNGAMTLRSWRGGPAGRRCRRCWCFNGAMTLRSWRAAVAASHSRSAVACFNGAMTLRSWRGPRLRQFADALQKLQWGHDLAVMERLLFMKTTMKSTGLQWGHDLAVMERPPTCWPTSCGQCFNGAMTLRSWRAAGGGPGRKQCSPMLQWGHDLAVMERPTYTRAPEWWSRLLQWGHDLAVMERSNPSTPCPTFCLLQWGHDLAVMESTAGANST